MLSADKITIQVNLHAILRNLAQNGDGGPIEFTLPGAAHVEDILPLLKLPKMEVVFSLNSMIVDGSATLKDGDQVDIIPAISGGYGRPEPYA